MATNPAWNKITGTIAKALNPSISRLYFIVTNGSSRMVIFTQQIQLAWRKKHQHHEHGKVSFFHIDHHRVGRDAEHE